MWQHPAAICYKSTATSGVRMYALLGGDKWQMRATFVMSGLLFMPEK